MPKINDDKKHILKVKLKTYNPSTVNSIHSSPKSYLALESKNLVKKNPKQARNRRKVNIKPQPSGNYLTYTRIPVHKLEFCMQAQMYFFLQSNILVWS